MGGKTRIGGEYLGGKLLASTTKHESDGFINRFGEQNKIKNAKYTTVGVDSEINVSSLDGKGVQQLYGLTKLQILVEL